MIANESNTTGSEQLMGSTEDVEENANSDALEAELIETSDGNSLAVDSDEEIEADTFAAPERG